jgi:hypothetical protein
MALGHLLILKPFKWWLAFLVHTYLKYIKIFAMKSRISSIYILYMNLIFKIEIIQTVLILMSLKSCGATSTNGRSVLMDLIVIVQVRSIKLNWRKRLPLWVTSNLLKNIFLYLIYFQIQTWNISYSDIPLIFKIFKQT